MGAILPTPGPLLGVGLGAGCLVPCALGGLKTVAAPTARGEL